MIGVDKLTQFGCGSLPLVEESIEVQQGMVMPALYAMRAKRFLHERDASVEDARFAMTDVTGGGLSGLYHGACTVHIFEKHT